MMIMFLFDWHDQIKKIHNEKKSEVKKFTIQTKYIFIHNFAEHVVLCI